MSIQICNYGHKYEHIGTRTGTYELVIMDRYNGWSWWRCAAGVWVGLVMVVQCKC